MLMMRPAPCCFMCGKAAAVAWNTADRFSARIASHFSTGNSSIDAVCWMPALFTRMSMRPIFATAWSIMPRTASPRDRSALSCATRTPNSASNLERMRSISAASPKPFSTMSAPVRASAVAMPRPIPLVEPVTTATFPENMGELPLGVGRQCTYTGQPPLTSARCRPTIRSGCPPDQRAPADWPSAPPPGTAGNRG